MREKGTEHRTATHHLCWDAKRHFHKLSNLNETVNSLSDVRLPRCYSSSLTPLPSLSDPPETSPGHSFPCSPIAAAAGAIFTHPGHTRKVPQRQPPHPFPPRYVRVVHTLHRLATRAAAAEDASWALFVRL